MGAAPNIGKIIFRKPFELNVEDFNYFSSVLEEKTGIHLTYQKKELIESRLNKYVAEKSFNSFSEYKNFLSKLPASDPEWQQFINKMTTNKTDFFREENHFQFLQEYAIKNFKDKPLRIWCAASSTGEEPYTIAYTLNAIKDQIKDYSILATDLDSQVLKIASNGVYNVSSVEYIEPHIVDNFFDRGKNKVSEWLRVKSYLKEKIKFAPYNLIDPRPPESEPFDIIFCRNVLFYFTSETSEQIVNKLHKCTKPKGLLLISHSESIQKLNTNWKLTHSSIYIKN